jgi:NADH-quinone oxidoreductase subunit F
MTKILDRIEHGKGEQGDVDLLERVASNIMGNTLCPLGDAAAMMMLGFLKKFKDEFNEHIKLGACPLKKK